MSSLCFWKLLQSWSTTGTWYIFMWATKWNVYSLWAGCFLLLTKKSQASPPRCSVHGVPCTWELPNPLRLQIQILSTLTSLISNLPLVESRNTPLYRLSYVSCLWICLLLLPKKPPGFGCLKPWSFLAVLSVIWIFICCRPETPHAVAFSWSLRWRAWPGAFSLASLVVGAAGCWQDHLPLTSCSLLSSLPEEVTGSDWSNLQIP